MLERKSPLSQIRILGKFGHFTEEMGLIIRESKDFVYLEMALWPQSLPSLRSKFLELFSLKAFPEPGQTIPLKGGHLIRSGPNRLTYYGDSGPEDVLLAMVGGEEGSVVSLSHSRCALHLTGPKVRDVLERGIRVDLSATAFPVGGNAFTEIHGMSVLVLRTGELDFDLVFMRTTARNLWTWLTETAAQFGYEVL